MARKKSDGTSLKPPFLKRVWVDLERIPDRESYPFCLPLINGGLDWRIEKPITIIVGENGSGKSTLLEGIAALAGYDHAGGGKGYNAVDHSSAIEVSGAGLADALRAAWLPKITNGWFFRAESFFDVARYLDRAAQEPMSGPPPDFLSHSHGEGFLRFFEERCARPGLYIFDEPESALSPARQLDFLRLLHRIDKAANAQVIMATHSPILMAYPDAQLVRISRHDVTPTTLEATEHFRLYREFCANPAAFVLEALGE